MALTHLPHVDGATEPWITDVVCALVAANDAHRVLETGGFQGHTSSCLAQTLAALEGERELLVCDIDVERATAIDNVLRNTATGSLRWTVLAQDVLQVITLQPDASLDAVWIDDDHVAQHVADEVYALLPKMRPGGLLLFHDVYGSCQLHEVVRAFGGYSLDLPRLGPAGGLGIVQIPR